MDEVAVCVEVVARGTVSGVEPGWGPERVAGVFGEDFAENRRGDVMWRDYGLVEFSWGRRTGDGPWRGERFTVQVHRLAARGVTVPLQRLRDELGGLELVEVPGAMPGVRELWQPGSLAWVLVAETEGAASGVPIGCVYAVGAPLTAEAVAVRRLGDQVEPLSQALRGLRDGGPDRWARWAARRQPAGAAERADWWLLVVSLIRQRVEHPGSDAGWARLYEWATRQAGANGGPES